MTYIHDEKYGSDDIQDYEEDSEYSDSSEDEMVGMARTYGFNLLRHSCAIDSYYDENEDSNS